VVVGQRLREGATGRWRFLAALLALAVAGNLALVFAADAGATVGPSAAKRPDRVLILSLPTLTWADLQIAKAPTLARLLKGAAVADLATRSDRQPSRLGPAYVTIGAGTRAAGDELAGDEGFEVGERFGAQTAGSIYRQRTGRAPGRGLVDLGIPRVKGANSSLLYGAEPGALGDTLAKAGYSRAVIANADWFNPDAALSDAVQYSRPAVGALMGSDGRVPGGKVGAELLKHDARAPFGLRLNPTSVERAFTAAWKPQSVVLVETSDLSRTERIAPFASATQQAIQRERAIEWSDHIVARLLAHVDLTRDTVLVVAPSPQSGDRSVTVAALRTPGGGVGLLRSATTRRSGFVTLVDVAPTVLDLLGIKRPQSMEGRPWRVGRTGGDAAERQDYLVQANADSLFRDELVNPVTAAVIWTSIVLVLAAGLLLGRVRRTADALRWIALALVGFILATLLAIPLHLEEHGGIGVFWLFVSFFAIGFAALCRLTARWSPIDPLLWALGVLMVVFVGDQFTGGQLEFNSVFGYSATVGIRFAGIGNASSALLTASAVIVAALLAWRVGGSRGTRLALLVLAISFVALTPPLFGQDFGGTLAAAPAFLLLAWILLGRRVTLRTSIGLFGVLVVSGVGVGLLDLLRPSDQQTHVGRFFDKIGNEGFSGFTTVIQRKGGENVASFSTPLYLLVIIAVVGVGILLWFRPPRLLGAVVARVPTLRPAGISLGILLLLSYALNDSGISIPAVMLAVVAASGAYLLAETFDPATSTSNGPGKPIKASPTKKAAPKKATTK